MRVVILTALVAAASALHGMQPVMDRARPLSLAKESDRLWVDAVGVTPLPGRAAFLRVVAPVQDARGNVTGHQAGVVVREGKAPEHLQPRLWLEQLVRAATQARIVSMKVAPDGRTAAAATMWTDGRKSDRGVVLLDLGRNGAFAARKVIEIDAVDLAIGANGVIAVIGRSQPNEPWRIFAYDRAGNRIAAARRPDHVQKRVLGSTIDWIRDDLYSYFDAAHDRVSVIRISSDARGGSIATIRDVDISEPPPRSTPRAYVLGAHVRSDGAVEVVRSIPGASVPLTSVSVYLDRRPAEHWLAESGTRYCYWDGGTLHLLTNDTRSGEPVLRSVRFR